MVEERWPVRSLCAPQQRGYTRRRLVLSWTARGFDSHRVHHERGLCLPQERLPTSAVRCQAWACMQPNRAPLEEWVAANAQTTPSCEGLGYTHQA